MLPSSFKNGANVPFDLGVKLLGDVISDTIS
jgi:hypothetical protein